MREVKANIIYNRESNRVIYNEIILYKRKVKSSSLIRPEDWARDPGLDGIVHR